MDLKKAVKAIIHCTYYKVKTNEPWKSESMEIELIRKIYEDGSFDDFYNNFLGFKATKGFFDLLPEDCEIFLMERTHLLSDDYYTKRLFYSACFNRTEDNPYQLPNFLQLPIYKS